MNDTARLSVDQYHEMIRSGLLTEDAPVELLEGRLRTKMPKNPAHRLATGLMRQALEHLVPAGWHVDSQEPLTLEDSEPEPDVLVVRGERRDYLQRHPGPQDVALLVEVADTSLVEDRTSKKAVYARAGVPIYWIVNLDDRRLEVFTEPTGATEPSDYRQRQIFGSADTVAVKIGGVQVGEITVRDLLP
jgi:Uma2 family endonuclease